VQLGTAYLFCPEAKLRPAHRAALLNPGDTTLTNVFTGRPARGFVNRVVREVGPMSEHAPEFPLASGAIAPLRAISDDFLPMWSGQAARFGREIPAGELTRRLWEESLKYVQSLVEALPPPPASGR
jgi:nitronate monooxygenase